MQNRIQRYIDAPNYSLLKHCGLSFKYKNPFSITPYAFIIQNTYILLDLYGNSRPYTKSLIKFIATFVYSKRVCFLIY